MGEKIVDFQVNGQTYFLTLGENEREWIVFESTPSGPRLVRVYDDAEEYDDATLVIEDKDRRKIVN